jgi:hypothetical protein
VYSNEYKGVGRATTFNDRVGQANIVLSQGDVALKLAYDNCAVGTLVSLKAKKSNGSWRTCWMTKNDAGGMPNAVIDIWKTGVAYWGYTWSSTFSMPGTVTYTHQ